MKEGEITWPDRNPEAREGAGLLFVEPHSLEN